MCKYALIWPRLDPPTIFFRFLAAAGVFWCYARRFKALEHLVRLHFELGEFDHMLQVNN